MDLGRLITTLDLTVAGETHAIPGGQVKHIDLDLACHGFTGAVDFVLFDDKSYSGGFEDTLKSSFLGSDLIEVALTIEWEHKEGETAGDTASIELAGLVTRKRLDEVLVRGADNLPILMRRYRIEFADPARVLWSQHHPCALYTKTTVKDVVEAHTGTRIAIDFDESWETLTTERDMFFLHLDPTHEASFYDFLMWYVDAQGGVWAYDYAEKKYQLRAEKDASGSVISLSGDDIVEAVISFPEVPRHERRVLNSYVSSPATKEITQEQAVDGVYQDFLIRTAVSQDVDDRVTLETSRLRLPGYRVELAFGRGPYESLTPGTLVALPAENRWSSDSEIAGQDFRVVRLRLQGNAVRPEPEAELQQDGFGCDGSLTLELEQKDETCVPLPRFRVPRYPAHVEAMVVSTLGETDEKTFETYTDEDTSLQYYTVKVPLWSDQEITVPFEPIHFSGNAYIPAYRDERVLLAMGLENARIARLLEWREGAPLSMDVQGEQLYFGKSATSRTTVSHAYDGEDPVFCVARVHSNDKATMTFEEGTFILEVKEEEDEGE